MSEGYPNSDDFDLLSFKYNGSTWYLMAIVNNPQIQQSIPLLNANIVELRFGSAINNFIVTGSFIYIDTIGKLDRIIGDSYVTLHFDFYRKEGNSNPENIETFEKISAKQTTLTGKTFIINNVEILNREKNIITYKVGFISENWINATRRLSYSNYNKQKENVTDIIKELLKKSNLKFDEASFDKFKSCVKINYMTKANETIFQSIGYLFRRAFYDKTDMTEKSLKFLSYDMLSDKIYLSDLFKDNSFLSETLLPMSCFDDSLENLTNQQAMNIASSSKIDKVNFFSMFQQHKIYKYDSDSNEVKNIEETEFKPTETLNYFQNTFFKNFCGSTIQCHQKIDDDIQKVFVEKSPRWESYWNNKINIYDDMLQSILNNESLVLNVDGQILQSPGGLVQIHVDRELADKLKRADGATDDEIQRRYKKFEGVWLVSKVTHIIYPMQRKYKSNITICRNFAPNIKN